MQVASATQIAAGAVQAQSSADLLAQSILYSASVGGKTYPADINYSAGQYTASVPVLPGIDATGSSLLAAENNLDSRISILV